MKNYLMILLGVLGVGILTAPLMPDVKAELSSEETTQLNQTTETILLSEIDQASEIALEDIADTAKITATSTNIASVPASASAYNYTVNVPNYWPGKDEILSYNKIYSYGRLVYAHNSSNLLGNLKNLTEGNNFTISQNGISNTYSVSNIGYFKEIVNADGSEVLQKCNSSYTNCSGNWMSFVRDKALNHKIAVMTCNGYGDTPYRLIVFGD